MPSPVRHPFDKLRAGAHLVEHLLGSLGHASSRNLDLLKERNGDTMELALQRTPAAESTQKISGLCGFWVLLQIRSLQSPAQATCADEIRRGICWRMAQAQ
jgi:hypothetical protein